MQSTEKRIADLEMRASDDRIKFLVIQEGETQTDALKRVGLPPDARGIVWGLPLDELL